MYMEHCAWYRCCFHIFHPHDSGAVVFKGCSKDMSFAAMLGKLFLRHSLLWRIVSILMVKRFLRSIHVDHTRLYRLILLGLYWFFVGEVYGALLVVYPGTIDGVEMLWLCRSWRQWSGIYMSVWIFMLCCGNGCPEVPAGNSFLWIIYLLCRPWIYHFPRPGVWALCRALAYVVVFYITMRRETHRDI